MGSTHVENSTVAVSTSGTEQIMVVWLAVWMTITFEEVSGAQFLVAVVASEVLRMPGLAQSSDDLANNWLVAGVATSFLRCSYSLTAHVGL